ncbi:MAG: superoxide dismutase [Chitinophagaceae bacterium]|nr:superoxide dismutase [Chitinophagaceae bacterium]
MKKIITSAVLLLFAILQTQAQHTLPKLAYSYNALEPFIDAQTMEIHYNRHHQAYVTNLNNALSEEQKSLPITELLANISKYSPAIRNNAGGHYNHTMFWTMLTPEHNTSPSKKLIKEINQTFTNTDTMKAMLNKAGLGRFGSGWVWLVVNPQKKLMIFSTPNQDNPLMDIAEVKGTPILCIDLWEHAYYLKYQNKRGDYLSAIWNVIDWNEVSRRYEEAIR